MGIAEVVPGISGSTLALIMGIYDDFILLLHQVSEVVKEILKLLLRKSTLDDVKATIAKVNFMFGLELLFGMVITVLLFSNILTYLLDNYPGELFAVFFGVILVSIQVPYKRIKSPSAKDFGVILATTIVFFLIFGLQGVGQKTEAPYWYIFIGGVVGISGMVLPGVSGSFLLFLMGIYELIVSAVADISRLNFSSDQDPVLTLATFATGILVGFSVFIRGLKYALEKYPNYVMSFVTGLMIASLRVVWPFSSTSSNQNTFWLILLIGISGLLIGIFISKSNPGKELEKTANV